MEQCHPSCSGKDCNFIKDSWKYLKAPDKIPVFFSYCQEQEFVCGHVCLLTEAYLLKKTHLFPHPSPPLSSSL